MAVLLASVWTFILTLVRSLLALFSSRRRASGDPPRHDALARTHSRLRPILLIQRSITLSRTIPIPGHGNIATASTSVPQISDPQRTSPKLDPHDPELGLPVILDEHPTVSATTDTSTSGTGSLYVVPLTPPDRCYLPPLSSTSDRPYSVPWPTGVPLDRSNPQLSGGSFKWSINTDPAFPEPMVAPIGSPPPGRWSPIQILTSTPCKMDDPVAPDVALSSFDHSGVTPSSALANLSHAIITRSQSSIQPYDDASNSSVSSDANPSADLAETRPHSTLEPHRVPAHIPRSKHGPCPQFHHPDAYKYTRYHRGDRLPGKVDRTHAYSRSKSDMDLPASEWYDDNAYAPSPVAVLSPPRCEDTTGDEDEDEMPLYRLREHLRRRSAAVGAGTRKAATPRTRPMSEGCLLALSESTPTRIGMGSRSGRQVLSMALQGDECKDWLEALSLRFSSEQKNAPEPCMTVLSIDVVAA